MEPTPGEGLQDGRARLDALAAALADQPGVTLGHGRSGFGSGTLMVDGRIFALVSDERLVLKLPAPRVKALISEGHGLPYTAGKTTPLREWVELRSTADAWTDLGWEALRFVGGDRTR
jgi:TfoX N-terminal domain